MNGEDIGELGKVGVVDTSLLAHFQNQQAENAVANTTPFEEQNPLFPPLSQEQLAVNALGIALVRAAHAEGKARAAHIQPEYGKLRLVQ